MAAKKTKKKMIVDFIACSDAYFVLPQIVLLFTEESFGTYIVKCPSIDV